MSNFNHIPDEIIPLPSGSGIERGCQTCAHCTWDEGNKCLQPEISGYIDSAEHGHGILTAYKLCRGRYWQEQEWEN